MHWIDRNFICVVFENFEFLNFSNDLLPQYKRILPQYSSTKHRAQCKGAGPRSIHHGLELKHSPWQSGTWQLSVVKARLKIEKARNEISSFF